MIPNLIMDSYYAFNEEYVNDQIQKSSLDGSINGRASGRVSGIRYIKTTGGKELLAWQCNVAYMQSINVKLPTIIHIIVDNSNIIQAISLNEHFKGSQGITCSWNYLNRNMQNNLLASEFSPRNLLITNPLTLACRHLYELVLGSCTFADYCESQGIDNAFVSESMMMEANKCDNKIESVDRICINGNEVVTKISVSNYHNSLEYDSSGTICACNGLRISGYSYCDNAYSCIGPEKIINANSSNEFKMKVMKMLSKSWLDCGKRLGVQKGFYFSHFWPPTSYGLLVQGLALSMFSDNFPYFQRSISGIQRAGDRPSCIGVINSVEEGERTFYGFTGRDLV